MKRAMMCALCAVMLAACADVRRDAVREALSGSKARYALFVSKGEFALYVYDRSLRLVRRYLIAYGLNPDRARKLYAGDNRTPEGVYPVVEMLSMDADRNTDSYRKLAMMNRVFFRARDGHSRYGSPDEDLGDNAYGPRFYLLGYPSDGDRKRYGEAVREGRIPMKNGAPLPIGHGIAIHGNNDSGSIGHLATSGCVRMYNDDIIDLERYIEVGTPVIISP